MSIIVAILVFSIIIIIHELGHFLVAKLFNVKIKQFAIGFGPTIWKKQNKKSFHFFCFVLRLERRLKLGRKYD